MKKLLIGFLVVSLFALAFSFVNTNQALAKASRNQSTAGVLVTVVCPVDEDGDPIPFTAWVEDSNGQLVKTLAFSHNKNTKASTESIAAKARDFFSKKKSSESKVELFWDLTDEDNSSVPNGIYQVFVEMALSSGDNVCFSAMVEPVGASRTLVVAATFTEGNLGMENTDGRVEIRFLDGIKIEESVAQRRWNRFRHSLGF
ncbi:MAG: hypothetical protein FWG10_14075 [Eubacteriaceae bacterium]|nr:hypothetical protein [Eubacteriaceae bacterium]